MHLDGTIEYACEQKRGAMGVDCSLPPHSHIAVLGPHKHRILVDPQGIGVQWNKASEYKVCYIYNWVTGGADSSERPCFPLEPELASNAERRQWRSRKHKWSRNPIASFLALLPHISQQPRPKHFFCPFSPYLLLSKSKVESVGWMCVSRNEIIIIKLVFCSVFHCSGENKIYMHVGAAT